MGGRQDDWYIFWGIAHRPTSEDFFVAEYLFVRLIASGCAHVAWFWPKGNQGEAIQSVVMHPQLSDYNCCAPINDVKVKNISSCENSNVT